MTDEEFIKKFDTFLVQYELDMRGDKDVSNGNKGIVGEIRDIKKYQKEHPSLLWLLRNYPIKAGGVIVGVFFFLMTLYNLGMFKLLASYFNLSIP